MTRFSVTENNSVQYVTTGDENLNLFSRIGEKYESIKVWIEREIKLQKGFNDKPMAGNDFYERAEAKVDVLEELSEFIKGMDSYSK